jgi:hypothetical protein
MAEKRQNTLSTKNSDIILTVFAIFSIIVMMIVFYYKFKPPDLTASGNIDNVFGIIMFKRLQSIITFTIFLILVFVFYFWNPWGLASKYLNSSTMIILFVGIFLIGFMINYTLMFSVREQVREKNTVGQYFLKSAMILTAIGLSTGLIYWLMTGVGNLHSSSGIISFIINLFLLLCILGLVVKVLMSSVFVQTSPPLRFIINFTLYIPCIFVSIIDTIVILFTRQRIGKVEIGNKTELLLCIMFSLLLIAYFTLPYLENYYALQGGKQLINQPIYLNSQHDISNYLQLNDVSIKDASKQMIFDYQYGVSFWIYLDSVASGQDKYMTLFNYGDKPRVLYKSSTNTLMITEQPNDTSPIGDKTGKGPSKAVDPSSIDQNGNRIVYKNEKVLLQKWNNIILNYNGGTLDIFINGKLVKSEPNVVPYMTMDTLSVGENNGVHGGVCNLIYFKTPLSSRQVYYLYNSMKYKSRPTLYSSTESITKVLPI